LIRKVIISFIIISIFLSCSQKESNITQMENKINKYIKQPDQIAKYIDLNDLDSSIRNGKFKDAYDILFKTYNSLPKNEMDGQIGRYLLIRIAHIYIYSKMWDEAMGMMVDIMHYPNSVGNPLLHLRVGQIALELKNRDIYQDNLSRALIMGGLDVFSDEDIKLKEIPLKLLKPPSESGWEEYQGQDWEDTM
jgi:hypothetical protein